MKKNILFRFFASALFFSLLAGVSLNAAAQCAGMPNAGVPFGGPQVHTCSGSANLDLGGATTGVGMSYQWEYSTDGVNWFPLGGPQMMTPVNTGTIFQTTMFHVVSTCTFSGMSNISSSITITINPGVQVTPIATITPNTGTTACVDDTITFTSTITDGGTNPSYQWQINGMNVGTNSTTFTALPGTIVTNDNVSLTVTSSNPCAVPQTALASVTMTVLPLVTPTVSIQATQIVICQGEQVTFTAQDNAPGGFYQWYRNGIPVGPNASSYTYLPTMGDTISLEFTPPTAGCYENITVTSNIIPMDVTPGLPTEVNITAVASAPENSWVTVYANLFNFNLNYTIDWYINNAFYTTTTQPHMSYQKGPGVDNIFAVANNTGTGCYLVDTSNTLSINSVPTSVNSVRARGSVQVYPNPSSGSLKITGLTDGDIISVLNILGQVLSERQLQKAEAEETIDLRNEEAGNYLLQIHSEDGSFKEVIRISKN